MSKPVSFVYPGRSVVPRARVVIKHDSRRRGSIIINYTGHDGSRLKGESLRFVGPFVGNGLSLVTMETLEVIQLSAMTMGDDGFATGLLGALRNKVVALDAVLV